MTHRCAIVIASAFLAGSLAGPANASETPPSITSAGFSNHHVTIVWRGPDSYNVFNIRYSAGPLGAIPTWQSQVGGGTGGSFTWLPPQPGSYSFIVEGCRTDSLGIFRSDCSKWSTTAQVTVPQEPPPQQKTFSWGPMSAGDCRMQNAVVTFNSFGGGTFRSQVETTHTHSGDVWHATITAQNSNGQTVAGLGTFDSMRMDDNHGWYDWSQSFTYDQAQFANLSRADMHHSC